MHLSELIKRHEFIVTCEIDPPKGTNVDEFLDRVDMVKDHVDAINIGDNQRAVMRAAALAVCHLLKERNVETIMEVTACQRNRIAIQSDMLGAAILGIENILLIAGHEPSVGDHAEAAPVHDLDTVSLVNAAVALTKGTDMTGHPLNQAPDFCLGVTATPGLVSDELLMGELKQQIASGVHFIQTQPIYEPEVLERFIDSISGCQVPVIVGHVVLKSASMARFMNSNFPGVTVPEKLIEKLEGLRREQVVEASLQISADLIKKMKPNCQGVSFIPAGWEMHVPRIVEAIGGRLPRSTR